MRTFHLKTFGIPCGLSCLSCGLSSRGPGGELERARGDLHEAQLRERGGVEAVGTCWMACLHEHCGVETVGTCWMACLHEHCGIETIDPECLSARTWRRSARPTSIKSYFRPKV